MTRFFKRLSQKFKQLFKKESTNEALSPIEAQPSVVAHVRYHPGMPMDTDIEQISHVDRQNALRNRSSRLGFNRNYISDINE